MARIRNVTRDIALNCLDCGACCENLNGRVPFDETKERVPAWYKAEHDATSFKQNTKCPWWKPGVTREGSAGECLHHGDRPLVCQKWEIGGPHCQNVRDHFVEQLERGMVQVGLPP